MQMKFRSIRSESHLGVVMIFPTGEQRLVAEILVPMDGDWRADVELYDEFIKVYGRRLKKALANT